MHKVTVSRQGRTWFFDIDGIGSGQADSLLSLPTEVGKKINAPAGQNLNTQWVWADDFMEEAMAIQKERAELQRRAEAQGWPLSAYAAHPGWAQTGLMQPEPEGASLAKTLIAFATPVLGQSAAEGALPILFAATSPQARPGAYYGPDSFGGMRGGPTEVKPPDYALDVEAQERLWAACEALSGLRWG